MAALHADIPGAAHLTSEDRLEKLLQTFPFARATAPEVASELPVALETVVEAIDDHADARTATKSCEEAGASGHRRPGGCARHAAHHRLHAEPRQADAPHPRAPLRRQARAGTSRQSLRGTNARPVPAGPARHIAR